MALSEERSALKVCADPNSMPLSHESQQGYENRIAALLADKLDLPLEYTWFPQRRGFVRNTLRSQHPQTQKYKCDLIMGVPESFELAITTAPYYRSTYVMVYKNGTGLDDVKSAQNFLGLEQERKQTLRVGVFEQTPGALWLARQGMIRQMVPYITLHADPNVYPGQIIEEELLAGKIDAAILWGPIAGYFVKKNADIGLTMFPLPSAEGIRFDFPISMAVRFGEGGWKKEIEALINNNKDAIESILQEFNVPLVD